MLLKNNSTQKVYKIGQSKVGHYTSYNIKLRVPEFVK
jgi:hypothetical protein